MFYGKLVKHEKYGEQFQVESYERCKPEEKDSIIEFLTSGLFPGIGEKKAKQIVDTLGKDTLKIILENPDNLILIPGITKKNINVLHSKLKEYEASYEIIMLLGDMGFTTKDSMIIYNKYKDKTKDVISNNIYQLIDDIYELYFKKIDMIALKNGVEKDNHNRIKAAIKYIMNEVSNTFGHSYYSYLEIAKYLPRVLGIPIEEDIYKSSLDELEIDLDIIHKEDRYYLKDMYEAETLIVKRFRRLNSNKEKESKKLDSTIGQLEGLFDIKYNTNQLLAIEKSYKRDFLIICYGNLLIVNSIFQKCLGLLFQLRI